MGLPPHKLRDHRPVRPPNRYDHFEIEAAVPPHPSPLPQGGEGESSASSGKIPGLENSPVSRTFEQHRDDRGEAAGWIWRTNCNSLWRWAFIKRSIFKGTASNYEMPFGAWTLMSKEIPRAWKMKSF